MRANDNGPLTDGVLIDQAPSPSEDSRLLDFVESQGDGNLWLARAGLTGRGFRLVQVLPHEVAHYRQAGLELSPTAREALRQAMRRAGVS